ncbi:MAG: hypothetical protein OEZ34_10275 [Spirochaetia bacterium]|nr:hypothetical protein [Spirochaetia bacterium]
MKIPAAVFSLFFLIITSAACKDEKEQEHPSSEIVKISVKWDYIHLPGKMELYDLSGAGGTELWKTGIVKNFSDLPVSTSLKSTLEISPGEKKSFVLVYKNTTGKDLFFFAAPHSVSPPEISLGFKFKCLCINHTFKVPSDSYWYRIVQISLDQNFLGDQITVMHQLIATKPNHGSEYRYTN